MDAQHKNAGNRTSEHRNWFNKEEKFKKTELFMHAKDIHAEDYSLSSFFVAVVKKVSTQHLRREKFRFIDKHGTIPFLRMNR